MEEIELEKTYLAKYLPEDIDNSNSKKIIDIYIPKDDIHKRLRVRQNGDKYIMTKKTPVNNARSEHIEENIILNKGEFDVLSKIDGSRVAKKRYFYDINGMVAEIDVFEENLKGLVLVDFEFEKKEDMDKFVMPDFCLCDVTCDIEIAGGFLAGKSIEDIDDFLVVKGYSRL